MSEAVRWLQASIDRTRTVVTFGNRLPHTAASDDDGVSRMVFAPRVEYEWDGADESARIRFACDLCWRQAAAVITSGVTISHQEVLTVARAGHQALLDLRPYEAACERAA